MNKCEKCGKDMVVSKLEWCPCVLKDGWYDDEPDTPTNEVCPQCGATDLVGTTGLCRACSGIDPKTNKPFLKTPPDLEGEVINIVKGDHSGCQNCGGKSNICHLLPCKQRDELYEIAKSILAVCLEGALRCADEARVGSLDENGKDSGTLYMHGVIKSDLKRKLTKLFGGE